MLLVVTFSLRRLVGFPSQGSLKHAEIFFSNLLQRPVLLLLYDMWTRAGTAPQLFVLALALVLV